LALPVVGNRRRDDVITTVVLQQTPGDERAIFTDAALWRRAGVFFGTAEHNGIPTVTP
jgi:hypothetical protein